MEERSTKKPLKSPLLQVVFLIEPRKSYAHSHPAKTDLVLVIGPAQVADSRTSSVELPVFVVLFQPLVLRLAIQWVGMELTVTAHRL